MIPSLSVLRAAGVLRPLDEHLAAALGRIGGDERPEVLLAAALVNRQVANGHVCLDLHRFSAPALLALAQRDLGGARRDRPFETEDLSGLDWPAPGAWIGLLRGSPLVGVEEAATPLVFDAAGRLYLRRYWEHQKRLVDFLGARAGEVSGLEDARSLREGIERLFPRGAEGADTDWQRVAAAAALRRRFCVISGGPGTGKTFTVVKILALLIEDARRRGAPALRATLAAPTGKAAARLTESIRRAKHALACAEEVRRAVPDEAATIHRCLGSMRGSATAFRHDADNPLSTDLVLVDEASMVDLALMRRLVDAVPPSARLILLGDKDQLASVEAGAVLGDICNTGRRRGFSPAFAAELAELSGESVAPESGAAAATAMCDCIVELTHSYRYRPDSGIGALARAINSGDAGRVLELVGGAAGEEVSLVSPEEGGGLGRALEESVEHGFGPYLDETDPAERLRAFDRFRVLCAHRTGWHGVESVNREIVRLLTRRGRLEGGAEFYPGRPIMITRNDYELGLFNGDVGLIVERPAGAGRCVAVFTGADDGPRFLSPARLPEHETVFAMTVHKSQGSEYDEVAVLLPAHLSPVLSRELLYTAVTRARQRVALHARRDVLEAAVRRRIDRASGLRDLLWD